MFSRAPLVAQTVKNPPEMQETQVRSLGREDALVTHPPVTYHSEHASQVTATQLSQYFFVACLSH